MKPENPTEPFKRAVGTAVRALAGERELEVSYSAEPPQLRGQKARLPLPSRNLPPHEVAVVRGAGDAYALKLAYHESKVHDHFRPRTPEAASLFEAAEQARVEAIGALAMPGVANNLAANLDMTCSARGMARAREKSDVPLADALGLIVREKLTGMAPPETARRAVDMWRSFIEKRAGKDLDKLLPALRDQKAFAKLTRTVLKDLDFGEESENDSESEADGENKDGSPEDKEGGEEQDASGESSSTDGDVQDADSQEGEEASADMRAEEGDELSDSDEPDDGARPWRPDQPFSHQDEWGYKIYTTQFDEVIEAEELCDPEELARLRNFLDQQLLAMQGVVARLANKLQRLLMAQQNRVWEFDLEEGLLDTARLTRVVVDAMHPLSFKREKDTDFRDTVVTLLLDNSGSMRGRPIMVAAMCADILGAHAGTLRGEGGGSGLHHARLERRTVAGEMARRGQAAAAGPPQRSAPCRLQERRRTVAAGAAQSRPDDARRTAQGEHRRRGADVGA